MFNSSASHLVNLSKKSDIFSKFGLSNQSPVINLVNTAIEKLDDEYKKIAQKYIRDVKEDFQIVEDYIKDENEVVVLWVDDEPFNDIFEISLLKLFNISYEIASSTQEAIKILKTKKEIRLIISDCYRSDSIKDAFDLCDKLYSDIDIQDVPIIFHSNSELASTDEILRNIDALKKKHEQNKHLIHYNYSSIQELIKGIGEILSEQIKVGKI